MIGIELRYLGDVLESSPAFYTRIDRARKWPQTSHQAEENATQERSRTTVDSLIEATARILVKEGFGKASTHRLDPQLHRVLAEQIPRMGKLEKQEFFSRENFSLFKAHLESVRRELGVDDLELASFVCVTAIKALTHNAVLHHSEALSADRMEALIDNGARLVTGYLKGQGC